MNNMHSNFSKDSLVLGDVHTPRQRPSKRDIATLYSTDMSYQLQKATLVAQGRSETNSDLVISAFMKFHQFSR